MNSLQGKSAIVTGGSRGLGRALGLALARAGARVVLVARHIEPLRSVVAEIGVAGGEAHAVVADVADKDAATRVAGQAAALVGPVDILINNASTLGPVPLRLLLDTDCEELERTLAVNVVGPFRLTKAVAGQMVLRGGGTVVNITSDAAIEPYQTWGAYGASKAALEQLGRIWAAELEGTGVRVLTVDPGEMDTAMHADAMPDADRAQLADPAPVAEAIVHMIVPAGAQPAVAQVGAAAASARRPGERIPIRIDSAAGAPGLDTGGPS